MSDEFTSDELEQAQTEMIQRPEPMVSVQPRQAVVPRDDTGDRQQAAAMIAPRGATETAAATAEIARMQAMMQMAMMRPRDLDRVRYGLSKALQRLDTAEKAVYAYPRGSQMVKGPSIYMAREIKTHWGNLITGWSVLEDTEEKVLIRAFAWDLETNIRAEADSSFRKLVQRKEGNQTQWRPASEREILELTNKNAAKAERNVILSIIPDDLKRDAIAWASATMARGIAQDPEAVRKNIVAGFARYSVTPKEIEAYAGCSLEFLGTKGGAASLQNLRACFARIQEGEVTWHGLVLEKAAELGHDGPAPATAEDLRDLVSRKAQQSKKKGQQ